MQERLKAWIDPARMSPSQELRGRVAVAELENLSGLVIDDGAELRVVFALRRTASGRTRLSGRLDGEISLTCQRCLTPMVWPLAHDIEVELVSTDAEAGRVEDDVEPCMLVDGRVMLRELVAEEVLLSIPFAPRHAECGPAGPESE